MTGYCSKYQSEIKSQKIIINTKKYSEYLDDINILITDTKKVTRKYIKSKYLTTIEKLKVLGYNNKATKLAKAQLLIQEPQKQLNKSKSNIKKAYTEIKQLKQSTTKIIVPTLKKYNRVIQID